VGDQASYFKVNDATPPPKLARMVATRKVEMMRKQYFEEESSMMANLAYLRPISLPERMEDEAGSTEGG